MVSFAEPALIYTVLCSVVVFCFFNFRRKAKCFAGDVGSVSIAFILLFLIGKLILKTEDFSWMILLAVYGVDSVLTIIHRLMLHENIGLPHRKHMYQLMANEFEKCQSCRYTRFIWPAEIHDSRSPIRCFESPVVCSAGILIPEIHSQGLPV